MDKKGAGQAVITLFSILGLKPEQTFHTHAKKKPTFMCVIVGHLEVAMRDPKTGIFIIPLTALRP